MNEIARYHNDSGKFAIIYDNDFEYSVVTQTETGREDIMFFESQISAYRYCKEWMAKNE
jgi:hypothetical protein